MGALAELSESALAVVPGDQVTTRLRVRNAGDVVDEFTFEAIGDPGAWVDVQPPMLHLMPGVEDEVEVRFAPPRQPASRAGEAAFGIKVNSSEDPAGSVVEEGILTVGPFQDVVAELVPRTSTGRRRAAHELSIDNRGNDLVDARISALDDDEALDFRIADTQLLLPPGGAAFTTVQARPKDRFWRGPDRTLPFRVRVATHPDEEPLSVDGTMVQRPMVPAWLPKVLLALLALLLLLWILWATLLQPEFESRLEAAADEAAAGAVEEALATPLADLAAQGSEQDEAIADIGGQVDAVASEVAEFTGTPVPTEPATPATPTPVVEEANSDVRLDVAAGPGGSDTDAFTVGADDTFRMTDIILQNPRGNVGDVVVRRGGQQLLVVALENFRDLDYHFVAPVVFAEGEQLVLELDCTEVTEPGTQCSAAAYVSGTTLTEVPPTE